MFKEGVKGFEDDEIIVGRGASDQESGMADMIFPVILFLSACSGNFLGGYHIIGQHLR